jgi:hypothetical protein
MSAIETGRVKLFRELLFGLRFVQNTYMLLCGWRVELPNVKSGKVKVKQSHYRPGQAQRVLRVLRFPDFVTTAQDGGKVSLTHLPPLPPGNTAGTYFC